MATHNLPLLYLDTHTWPPITCRLLPGHPYLATHNLCRCLILKWTSCGWHACAVYLSGEAFMCPVRCMCMLDVHVPGTSSMPVPMS